MRLAICVLASLLAGFVGGLVAAKRAVISTGSALAANEPETGTDGWLNDYLVTHTSSPATAGRN